MAPPITLSLQAVAIFLFLRSTQQVHHHSHHSGFEQHPPPPPREDLFSATTKLEGLFQSEHKVVAMLEAYVKGAEQRLTLMKRYIAEYHELSTSALGGASSLVANPIDAYLLLKRLTIDWSNVQQAMGMDLNLTHGFIESMSYLRHAEQFPVEDDLHGAAMSLVRLQDTYNLNMSEMAGGIVKMGSGVGNLMFKGVQTLSARDCLFLGKHSFHKGYYDKSIEWLEMALLKTDLEGNTTTSRDEIEPFMQTVINVHDQVLDERGPRGMGWQTYPSKLRDSFDRPKQSTDFTPELFKVVDEPTELDHYNRLCRGEKLRPAFLDKDLKCRFVSHMHPALLVQPLKLEEASLDPYIVIIHDFLTSRQCDQMMLTGKPKLQTSKHRSQHGDYEKSLKRTSQNAWVKNSDAPIVPVVSKRIEMATGLGAMTLEAAEDYQVANYGIGGLYVPHADWFGYDLNIQNNEHPAWEYFVGDRIATLMVYLSDVEAGGATVFPRIGVTLWPKKGAAAFWWNLHKSSQGDEMTRHGACPVLHGSKWIANKWIRLHEQMFKYPCDLNQDAKFQTP